MNSLQDVFDPLSGPVKLRNRRRNPFWRFRRLLFVLAILITVGMGSVLYIFSQTNLPEDRFDDIAQTSFLCTAEVTFDCGPNNATAMLSTAGEDREIVTYADLPQQLIDAVVATEDQDYFEHQGIDPRGIARAAYQFVRREGIIQGGSTITQQYVKLAFNDQDRTLTRKAREAIRAVKLEQDLSKECADRDDLGETTPTQCAKEEILTRYLNRAYFGRGASGVQAAARAYFGKDISQVDIAESAFLAGLLRNPNGADPESDLEEAERRRTTSLELMMEAGFITQEEAMASNVADWNVVPRLSREGLGEVTGAPFGSEYFVEEVRQQIDELFPNGEIYTRGLRVYTTLDQGLQRAAYESVHVAKNEDLSTRDLPELGPLVLDPANPDDPNAAIVSIDSAGRVVAMLGGANFDENEFNFATSSGTNGRQPGSTFKTLGLALAIEQGLSAQSFYPAVPGVTRVGPPCVNDRGEAWQVTGGSSAQYRYRTLLDALRWSSNIVFAQLVVDIGPNQLLAMAENLGITSQLGVPLANGTETAPCSLILGSQGVPVIDMAAAYSVFERDGKRLDPVLIERVEDSEGNVLCWYPVDGVCTGPDRAPTEVLAASTARQVTYALTQVVEGGTGRRARFAEDRAIAGKTGTSQENRDGWFAGFTCGMTTVVWVGHGGAEEIPMIDFRKPLAEGETEPPRDEDGDLIDDRGWPNIEGGNFPSMLWADYMAKATAGAAPCPELNTETEFPGTRLNQDLSTTTLPPCGVELDQWGFPRGNGPDNFVLIPTTTIAPPTSQPPTGQPGQGGDDQNQALPVQENNGGPPSTDPCIAIEEWIYQANPGDRPANPGSETTDPNAPGSTDPQPPDTEPNGQSTTVTTPPPTTTTTITTTTEPAPTTEPPTSAPQTSAPPTSAEE